MTFNRLYRERGKVIEHNLQVRNAVTQRLIRHGKKRTEHARASAKLDRELLNLIAQARRLEPPMSTHEIGRLSKAPKSNVHRYIQAGLIPEITEMEQAND